MMKVFKITFNTDEEAREEEFEIRDNMGSLVDTAIENDTVYITGPKAAAIAKDWYKGRKVEEIEMRESQFNSILNPKKSKMYEARVEFISEDAAYDAMGIWKNVLFPSIRPMSAFDPFTQKQLAIARRLADVEVEKDGETLIISSSSKAKVIEAVAIFNEDEDSVVSSTKPKRISESDMSLEDALTILNESGLVVEREMTPEQREAAKKRRQIRRAEKRGDPVNSGTFAVVLGNGYSTPEFFRDHDPVGTSDQVLKTIDSNRHKSRSAEVLGFYPTRKKAREVAISVMERILKMQKTAYEIEYNCPTPRVVNVVKDNKKWSNGISGPGDYGYIYGKDDEIYDEVINLRYSKLDEMKKREAEKEKRSRDDGWATNRNNPDSPIFKNVFAHH